MKASYYLQKLSARKGRLDVEYLGVDSEVSPEVIDFIVLKQGFKSRQNACFTVSNATKLDEYELAMATG